MYVSYKYLKILWGKILTKNILNGNVFPCNIDPEHKSNLTVLFNFRQYQFSEMPEKFFTVDEFVSKSLKQNQIKSELILPPPPKPVLHKLSPETTLFKLMKTPIIVAQCCGLFPVSGIGGETADSLEFRWISWRTLFASFCLSGNIVMAFFFFWWLGHRGLKLENMGKWYVDIELFSSVLKKLFFGIKLKFTLINSICRFFVFLFYLIVLLNIVF